VQNLDLHRQVDQIEKIATGNSSEGETGFFLRKREGLSRSVPASLAASTGDESQITPTS
jgi:hypothetical protein